MIIYNDEIIEKSNLSKLGVEMTFMGIEENTKTKLTLTGLESCNLSHVWSMIKTDVKNILNHVDAEEYQAKHILIYEGKEERIDTLFFRCNGKRYKVNFNT